MKKLAFLLIFLLPLPALATSFQRKVVGVTDGDTIKVLTNGKAEKAQISE